MDILSHVLWANLIIPGDSRLIVLGSIAPDILDLPNWVYHLAVGRGTFWRTKKDFIGLILGRNQYADGYKYVNHGPLYVGSLLMNSIWGIGVVLLFFHPAFSLAYAFHILIDVFTHKGSEEWQPFFPLSKYRPKIGFVRWGLDFNWYIFVNFIILALLYWVKFLK